VPIMREPKAGEVWYVDFDPQVGREQRGIRPALVISNDTFNVVRNGLHIVVPITSRDRGLAYHVKIEPPQGGLTKTSLAMCEQERSQSIDRFRRLQGTVTAETLHSVQRIVAELIDAYQLYR
jgi:mRNA interferase MazF